VNAWSAEAWRRVVESAPEGIVICDATMRECPAVFVNAAFEQMSGYPAAALLGTNLRVLQGTDRDQEGRTRLAEAVSKGEAARVLLRNYRPDGSMFWNEIVLQPVRIDGKLSHFVGWHRDASDRLKQSERVPAGLPSWMREDRLTGLRSRAYFEELLRRDWQLAQRDSHEIGLTFFDIDDLGAYNDKFDRSAGDACIRRVARVIAASYRRGGDLVARWDGGTFVVLTQGEAAERAPQYAKVVMQRVRELLMHHPTAAANGRYVTVSAGIASLVPPRTLAVEGLLKACAAALKRAKGSGKDAIATAEAGDFQK
jgi:diguanylate cyclase (GGDEF)-like protein/PAS domain S-box-containing protein